MKKDNKIIKNFYEVVNNIENSYSAIGDDKEELKKASYELVINLVALEKFSRLFKEGKISLDEFKKLIINIVTKETDQLIVVDDNGIEVTDEQKALNNYVVINSFDEGEVKTFATNFYRILSSARIFVHYKLNNEATIMILLSL